MHSSNHFLKKCLVFFLTIAISIVLAGIFGILHDQITYSISHEYYTKFKFYQFGITDSNAAAVFLHPRIEVSIVGWMATWWVGKWIGIVLGAVGLIFSDYKKMFAGILKALAITFITTVIFSVAGFLYGKYHLAISGVDWWLPDNLIDKESFIAVGSIHNLSYLGGAIGLLLAAGYLIWKNKTSKNKTTFSAS